ncbi:unnamed protein product [Amoebophrya sp. A25]|nr:unnamed protein product [Amoebophrya sp. A25]|eukprot:GSA25T00024582001.1
MPRTSKSLTEMCRGAPAASEHEALRLLEDRLRHGHGWTFVSDRRDDHLLILDETVAEEGLECLLDSEQGYFSGRNQGTTTTAQGVRTIGGAEAVRGTRLSEKDGALVCLGDSTRCVGASVITKLLALDGVRTGTGDKDGAGNNVNDSTFKNAAAASKSTKQRATATGVCAKVFASSAFDPESFSPRTTSRRASKNSANSPNTGTISDSLRGSSFRAKSLILPNPRKFDSSTPVSASDRVSVGFAAAADVPLANRYRMACYVLKEFAVLPGAPLAFPHVTELVFDQSERCIGVMIEPTFGPLHLHTTEYRVFDYLRFPAGSQPLRPSAIPTRGRLSSYGGVQGNPRTGPSPCISFEEETSEAFRNAGVTLGNPALRKALSALGVSDNNVAQVARVLAGLEVLSRIEFVEPSSTASAMLSEDRSTSTSGNSSRARLTAPSQQFLIDASRFLGLDSERLYAYLTLSPVRTPAERGSHEQHVQEDGFAGDNDAVIELDPANVIKPGGALPNDDAGDGAGADPMGAPMRAATTSMVSNAPPSTQFLRSELRRFIRVVYNRLFYRFVLRSVNKSLGGELAPMMAQIVEHFGKKNTDSDSSSTKRMQMPPPVDSPPVIPIQAHPGCLLHAKQLLQRDAAEKHPADPSAASPFSPLLATKAVVAVVDGLSDVTEASDDCWTKFFKNLAFEKVQGVFEDALAKEQAVYRQEGLSLDKSTDFEHHAKERAGLLQNMRTIVSKMDNFLHADSAEGDRHRRAARNGADLDEAFHRDLVEHSALPKHTMPGRRSLTSRTSGGPSGGSGAPSGSITGTTNINNALTASQVSFELVHYNGKNVEYDFQGWVARNERALPQNAERLMQTSSVPIVRVLLHGPDAESLVDLTAGAGLAGGNQKDGNAVLEMKSGSFASCFEAKTECMVNALRSAGNSRFIRLLLATTDQRRRNNIHAESLVLGKKADMFQADFVMRQLISSKMMHLFHLKASGFEYHLQYQPLVAAFAGEILGRKKRSDNSGGQAAESVSNFVRDMSFGEQASKSRGANKSSSSPTGETASASKTKLVLLNTEGTSPHAGGSSISGPTMAFLELLLARVVHCILWEQRKALKASVKAGTASSNAASSTPGAKQAMPMGSSSSSSSSSSDAEENIDFDDAMLNANGGETKEDYNMRGVPTKFLLGKDVAIGHTLLFLRSEHRRVYLFLSELLTLLRQGNEEEARQRLHLLSREKKKKKEKDPKSPGRRSSVIDAEALRMATGDKGKQDKQDALASRASRDEVIERIRKSIKKGEKLSEETEAPAIARSSFVPAARVSASRKSRLSAAPRTVMVEGEEAGAPEMMGGDDGGDGNGPEGQGDELGPPPSTALGLPPSSTIASSANKMPAMPQLPAVPDDVIPAEPMAADTVLDASNFVAVAPKKEQTPAKQEQPSGAGVKQEQTAAATARHHDHQHVSAHKMKADGSSSKKGVPAGEASAAAPSAAQKHHHHEQKRPQEAKTATGPKAAPAAQEAPVEQDEPEDAGPRRASLDKLRSGSRVKDRLKQFSQGETGEVPLPGSNMPYGSSYDGSPSSSTAVAAAPADGSGRAVASAVEINTGERSSLSGVPVKERAKLMESRKSTVRGSSTERDHSSSQDNDSSAPRASLEAIHRSGSVRDRQKKLEQEMQRKSVVARPVERTLPKADDDEEMDESEEEEQRTSVRGEDNIKSAIPTVEVIPARAADESVISQKEQAAPPQPPQTVVQPPVGPGAPSRSSNETGSGVMPPRAGSGGNLAPKSMMPPSGPLVVPLPKEAPLKRPTYAAHRNNEAAKAVIRGNLYADGGSSTTASLLKKKTNVNMIMSGASSAAGDAASTTGSTPPRRSLSRSISGIGMAKAASKGSTAGFGSSVARNVTRATSKGPMPTTGSIPAPNTTYNPSGSKLVTNHGRKSAAAIGIGRGVAHDNKHAPEQRHASQKPAGARAAGARAARSVTPTGGGPLSAAAKSEGGPGGATNSGAGAANRRGTAKAAGQQRSQARGRAGEGEAGLSQEAETGLFNALFTALW